VFDGTVTIRFDFINTAGYQSTFYCSNRCTQL